MSTETADRFNFSEKCLYIFQQHLRDYFKDYSSGVNITAGWSLYYSNGVHITATGVKIRAEWIPHYSRVESTLQQSGVQITANRRCQNYPGDAAGRN